MKGLTEIAAVILLLSCVPAASARTSASAETELPQQHAVLLDASKTAVDRKKQVSVKSQTEVVSTTKTTASDDKKQTSSKVPTTTAELTAASVEYKASSENVIRLQEEEIKKAESKLEQLRELVAEGLVARNELTASEQSLADLKQKLATTREQIADSERMVAELKTAEQNAKTHAAQAARLAASTRSLTTPTILRYNGLSGWSLAGFAGVQSFFLTTFGRSLPVSALGQSATHDRLGYDHRNAIDLALHPDSPEGRAVIAYLQRNGIPYLAFRSAVPGVATGPHIHIGSPSHRLG